MGCRRTGKEVSCSSCKAIFYVPAWHLKRKQKGRYCSHSCYAASLKNIVVRGKPAEQRTCIACGCLFQAVPSAIANGRGKACSKECAKVSISRTLTGRKNPHHSEFMKGKRYNFKADRSTLSRRIPRRNMRYLIWRQVVLQRDKHICKLSDGMCNSRLEVHHIKSFKVHEDLRYDANNGITVCHLHHPRGRKTEISHESYLSLLVDLASKGYEVHR